MRTTVVRVWINARIWQTGRVKILQESTRVHRWNDSNAHNSLPRWPASSGKQKQQRTTTLFQWAYIHRYLLRVLYMYICLSIMKITMARHQNNETIVKMVAKHGYLLFYYYYIYLHTIFSFELGATKGNGLLAQKLEMRMLATMRCKYMSTHS